MDAFDADVLIYAAAGDHPLGRGVRSLLDGVPGDEDEPLIGSVLLLPELLARPLLDGNEIEFDALVALVSRLTLLPLDLATAELATALAAQYRLRAADAVHLATAVNAGADRFVTNNRRDFDAAAITEVAVISPDEL